MKLSQHTGNKLVLIGGIGAVFTAICCFTPALVVGLAAVGVAGALAYLDFVLLPLLVLFAAMTYVGVKQVRKETCDAEPCETPSKEGPDE